jgi:dipeptidyl aminopeptidase/acylaminoacyl peptidase
MPRNRAPKPPAPSTPGGRLVTPDDLFAIALVSDPRPAPDGKRVAYVVTRLDKAADAYRSSIWLVHLDGGEPRQLTSGDGRDSHPRWSPDGQTIAFSSTRTPHRAPENAKEDPGDKHPPQVWTISVAGGEARQLTNRPLGASSPDWSPDGRAIAFLSSVEAKDDRDRPTVTDPVADERVIEAIRYRHDGRGFVAGKRTHIWTIPAAGGDPVQLTFGDVDDGDLAWSPDGRLIAFTGNRSAGNGLNAISAIYAVPAAGGDIRAIAELDASFGAPAWAPDGASIAFLGHETANASGRIVRVWTAKTGGGKPRCLTSDIDQTFTDEGMSDLFVASDSRPVWFPDGKAILTLGSARGETHIWKIAAKGGDAKPITSGTRRIAAFAPAGKQIVCLAADSVTPFELYACKADGSGWRQLTNHNEQFLAEVTRSPAEEIVFRSAAGDRDIQGWIITPPGFDPAVKHPMIVQIHGGPHAMYGHAPFHEMQLMAARGHVVLFTNPRGSAGYGEEFATCTRARWGEADMPDIMGAVDAAVALGFVDPDRIGVTGGSYGGYLTNWIVGHTDRFAAAVTQRCVANFHSMYGTSDIGFDFGEYEFGGNPWDDAKLLLKHSPITYAGSIRTPLLIIHNEADLRCPIEQAEQLFTALKRLERETRFIRIPDEDHNLSRTGTPSRRLARLHHLIGWFDSHL